MKILLCGPCTCLVVLTEIVNENSSLCRTVRGGGPKGVQGGRAGRRERERRERERRERGGREFRGIYTQCLP